MRQEEIKRQAKEIIDKFAAALDRAGIEEESVSVERKEDRRVEGEESELDPDFRKIMFENAPETENDFIAGEKKKWEE